MYDRFELPQYNEIPGVGLFLEQVAKYINEYIVPMGEPELTGSMISNYVKKDIIDNPVKKQYGREQIAYLIFIAITKNVLSLEDIGIILNMQKQVCDSQVAYEYFGEELLALLSAVFNGEPLPALKVEADASKNELKQIVRNVLVTVAHKIYLDKTFAALKQSDAD